MAQETFFKVVGQGNDFLIFLDETGMWEPSLQVTRWLCDRNFGIGADGLIVARRPESHQDWSQPYEISAVMDLYNQDGSKAEISGNGIRCLGKVLWDNRWAEGDTTLVQATSGVRKLVLDKVVDATTSVVSVEMGEISSVAPVDVSSLSWLEPEVAENISHALSASIGNPHLVLLVDRLEEFPVGKVGELAQSNFRGGINVEAISNQEPITSNYIESSRQYSKGLDWETRRIFLRVFERGVGLTLACGSGSCVAAYAAREFGLCDDRVVVSNPGGELGVCLQASSASLSGPVSLVGKIALKIPAIQ